MKNAVRSSQIGKSTTRTSLQNQQSLKRAMEEAQRLTQKSPLPSTIPVELPETITTTILNVLYDLVDTDDEAKSPEIRTLKNKTPEPIKHEIGSQPFESILQVLN